jgi:hypothetical protein
VYRDVRAIAGILAQVKARYYQHGATPKTRFLCFSSGAGLGMTILRYRNDLFHAYALAGHPVTLPFVQAVATTPVGTPNPFNDPASFLNLGFGNFPLNIGGPEQSIPTNTFDLVDAGNGQIPWNYGASNESPWGTWIRLASERKSFSFKEQAMSETCSGTIWPPRPISTVPGTAHRPRATLFPPRLGAGPPRLAQSRPHTSGKGT